MATAEQYAQWIVSNADKKGTPEFDTVAAAYKDARAQSQPLGADATPLKIGAEGFPDALRDTLKSTDWATRNIAGAGTALSNLVEGVKQFAGKDNKQRVAANSIIADEAPAGAFAGNVGLTAIPFGLAGNSLKAAGAVGAGYGALQPVSGDSVGEVAKNKLGSAALSGVLSVGGQAVANKVGDMISKKVADLATKKAQNSTFDATLKQSLDAGYTVPPSLMPDSSALARTAEGLSGKYKTNQLAGIRNQAVTDSLVRQAHGLSPTDQITSEAMQGIRKKAFDQGYAPVAKVGDIPTDETYMNALKSIVGDSQGAARSFPGAVSDDVTGAIFGKVQNGTPEQNIMVDSFGKILSDTKAPIEPPVRSLLHELKQSGGLATSEVSDLGTGAIHQNYPGLLRKQGGKTMDDVVEWMSQKGWLDDQSIAMADRDGVGGSHELARDMIRGALNRESVIHPADGEAFYAYQDALRNLKDQGVNIVKIPASPGKSSGALDVQNFDAGDAIKMIQVLRDDAGAAFAKGDKTLGRAKKEAAKAIEDQIERHLFSMGKDGGDLLKNFRAARKEMAKAHTTEAAIREGGGSVDAKYYGAQFQKGKPLSDGLDTVGAFANNFRDVAGIPKSGNASPLTALDFMQGGTIGALGGGFGAFALPAARIAARYGLLSSPVQKGMARPDYALGMIPRITGGLLDYAPVGGAVLGSNAFSQ